MMRFSQEQPEGSIHKVLNGKSGRTFIHHFLGHDLREVWTSRAWPGVEESSSYGTPALKMRGKLLVRLRELDVVVLPCEPEEKEFLKQVAPEVYFEIPHYDGYRWILAHLSRIDPVELGDRIERAWRAIAPKRLVADFDQARKTN